MISLATTIADLASRSTVARWPLVHLTTYSDHALGTVSQEFWWSDKPAKYKWGGGAVREFEPLLIDLSPLSYGFSHIPDGNAPDLRRSQARLSLTQEDRGGAGVLWKTLGLENLQFARVEIADLLVDASRIARGAGTAWWDLSDYVGTEHVVRFRGEFMELPDDGVSDERIEMVFQATEPNLALPEADAVGEVDPRDLGVRYALPFGAAKGVRCVSRDLGWVTTLAEPIDAVATGNVAVTDASGFPPSGLFRLQLGAERVEVSTVDDQNVSIFARAQGGTSAGAHQAGEAAAEVRAQVVLVAAGIETKALSELYVIDPSSGERVRVTTPYSVNLADDGIDVGRRLTTVTFTQAEYEELLDSLGTRDATATGVETLEITINALVISTEIASDANATPSLNGWPQLLGSSSLDESLLFTLDAAAIQVESEIRKVVRWRVVFQCHGEGGTPQKNTELDTKATFFSQTVTETPLRVFSAGIGSTEYGVYLATAWTTPATPKVVSDAGGGTFEAWINEPASGSGWDGDNAVAIILETLALQLELEPEVVAIPARAAADLRLQFAADIDGALVPFTYADGYAWADGDFWNVDGVTHSDIGDDQQFTVAAPVLVADGATVLGDCEDVTEWVSSIGSWTDDAVVFSEGAKSMLGTPTVNAQSPRIRTPDFSGGKNLTGMIVAADLRPNGSGHLDADDGVLVGMSSDGAFDTHFVAWHLGSNDLTLGSFITVYFDVDTLEGVDDHSLNPVDWTSVNRIWFQCNRGASQLTSHTLNVDNVRLIQKSRVAQRDVPASPTIDLTAYLNSYRLRIKATNLSSLDEVRIGFSNTDVSGTTKASSIRELVVASGALIEGTAVTLLLTGIDTGSPVVTLIRNLRVEIHLSSTPSASPVVTIEDLDVGLSTGLWGLSGGTLIEEAPDVLRYFLEILCGLTCEDSSFTTHRTNMAGDIFSGDYAQLGSDFGAILARLEYELRTNVLRVEKASGTEYRPLCAVQGSGVWTFPASVATLSQLRNLHESVRAALECPTRFLAHYDQAPGEVDLSERSFQGLLRASADQNDFGGFTPEVLTADLEAAETALGRRDAGPIYLLASRELTTATAVAGYYIFDALRFGARRWTVTVPLYDGNGAAYAVEPGDVVSLTPRWRTSAAKARVTQASHQMIEPMVGLVLEEVE